MKKILLVYCSKTGQNYRNLLQALKEQSAAAEFCVEELNVAQKTAVPCEVCLQKTDAEYIISLDMAGFQYKTLLDNFLYHIIPKKQLHLITDAKVWEMYKSAEFAMNLFVYVPDKEATDIQDEAENFNIRYYPQRLLVEEKELTKILLEDFMNMVK